MPSPLLSRRAALRLGALLPMGWAAAGCGSKAAGRDAGGAGPSPSATVPAGAIDIRRFGAVGDGRTDDAHALQRAFDALRPGQTLLLAAGSTFAHTATLAVRVPRVSITGGGTLSALAEGTSSLQLLADGIEVSDLVLAVPHTTRRWSAPDQHRLYLGPYADLVVTDVTVTGSAAAGIFSGGAQHFRVERPRVSDTRADGIHLTEGSAYGVVNAARVSRSGDDAVAVVSYEEDGRPCHDITVTAPVVRTTTGGRGVSVVGGHAIRYLDVDVDGSSAAAVYVACEGAPYDTFPSQDVQVTGGVVTGANTDAEIDHGAVLVYSGRAGGDTSDVTISGLRISGTRLGASRQIGVVADGGGNVSDVAFADISLQRLPTPYEGNVAPSAIRLQDVSADGTAVVA